MIADKNHFYFFIIQPTLRKAIYNLEAGFIFVVASYHVIAHWCSTRYVNRIMVGMRGAINRDVAQCLRPRRCIRGVRMRNAIDVVPMLIQHRMCFRVGRRTQSAFHDVAIKVNNHHFFRRQFNIWHTGRLNGKHT